MKRIQASGLRVGLIALMLGGAGCGGSGSKEGMPSDVTPVAPLDSLKVDMKARNGPPGGSRRAGATQGERHTKS